MSPKPTILITSATSRNGSEAARLLLADGRFKVRLAARDSTKLKELIAQGAEGINLDTASLDSMIQACTDVDFVYLILPVMSGGADITMFQNFLEAAKSTGIKYVVYLSAVDTAPLEAGTKTYHNHYEHEQMLLKSGIPFTALRPTYFYDNAVTYHGESIKWTGEFRTSAGDGQWTSVAVTDIAKATVVVFSDPSKHAGKIYTLESEVLTDKLLAEKISKATGKKVTHVNLTPEEHKEFVTKNVPGPIGDELANGLVILDRNKRDSLFNVVRPDLEDLLGHKGISMDEFLAEQADAFKLQPATA